MYPAHLMLFIVIHPSGAPVAMARGSPAMVRSTAGIQALIAHGRLRTNFG